MKSITPKELAEKIKKYEEVYILDVRAEEKYNNYHINEENIKSINLGKTVIFALEEGNNQPIHSLPINKEIIVTCTTGNSAKKCSAILAEKNYHVTLLEGGITAWKEFKDGN
ncbi:rhodanese-like domain-containing protein [Bacillus sp. FJAT-49705]|uniref:Rhodanese-like domain-containing protein n=1 Tax=Cytobacillus citreus TaxID=2833586 RepID=A0ABS5NQ58_9BACI|nr:rhodanese-like domain-containing protein [Cytobacillus citreus]MBS4189548.1 rhodanese-like domain-containing protein [Cytobacillus citreus]